MKNKIYLLLFAALMTAQLSKAQKCGVEPLPADWEQYRKDVQTLRTHTAQERDDTTTTLYVGVQFHILRDEMGNGTTEAAANKELDIANAKFAAAHIQFFQCGGPNIIVSNDWFNQTIKSTEADGGCGATTPEYKLTGLYNIPNVINIYWVKTDGSSWAYFPSAVNSICADWIIRNRNDTWHPALLAHELGHYFNLMHTFAGLPENVTRDALDGCFNCENAGDGFCDTPADYHYNAGDWAGCAAKDKTDDCGVTLKPDGLNVMSYSGCNDYDKYFSAEQRDMLRFSLKTQRNYLSCIKECAPYHILSGIHTGFHTFRAETYIHATTTLADGVTVRYEAKTIRLLPGFRAQEGTTFSATIAPCDAFSAPSETGDRQWVEPLVWSAQIAPSLVQESTVLTLDLKAETEISAWLTSADGRTVQWVFSKKTLSEGQHELLIQMADLPAAVYRVVVQTDTTRKVLSLAKL